VRLSGAVADPDLAAAGVRRLLRSSRHRVYARQFRRGAARRKNCRSVPQQRVDLDAGNRVLAPDHGFERLHAVAFHWASLAALVRDHLRVSLRALYLLGIAVVFRHSKLGHLRYLYRAAAAAHRGAYLLLLMADEGFFRRHRPV